MATIISGLLGEMNFSEMKEADVREDIITPLLKRIGYGVAGARILELGSGLRMDLFICFRPT